MDPAPDLDRPSDDLYRALVEQVCEALDYADRDGVSRLRNAAAETLFGVAAAGTAIGSIAMARRATAIARPAPAASTPTSTPTSIQNQNPIA